MIETTLQQAYFYFFPLPAEPGVIVSGEAVPMEKVTTQPLHFMNVKKFSKVFAGIGMVLSLIYITPTILLGDDNPNTSWVKPAYNQAQEGSIKTKNLAYQPTFDKKLPLANELRIPKLGVKTVIEEASFERHEEALQKGVWRADDSGTPFSRELPTILVAHRFGYLKWDNAYRRKNSFYNLPKLENGDLVEIVWRQRKYTYEIYTSSEGTEITDYSADLILYTCKDLNSDIRVIKYARLLTI